MRDWNKELERLQKEKSLKKKKIEIKNPNKSKYSKYIVYLMILDILVFYLNNIYEYGYDSIESFFSIIIVSTLFSIVTIYVLWGIYKLKEGRRNILLYIMLPLSFLRNIIIFVAYNDIILFLGSCIEISIYLYFIKRSWKEFN